MARPPARARLSVIVAMDRNRVIGRDNRLPWHIPEDLRRFKALTMGHPIIMGRKTFESIGRVLPGRISIVVTRQARYAAPDGVRVVHSLADALKAAGDAEEVFVIGGRELYEAALAEADRLYLTEVHGEFAGDTHFPTLTGDWRDVSREHRPLAGEGYEGYDFVVRERVLTASSGTPPSRAP